MPFGLSHKGSAEGAEPERRSRGELLRSGGLVLLAVVITLFAVLNLGDVKVDWVIGSGRAPLIIVIVVSVLVGVLLASLAERLHRRGD